MAMEQYSRLKLTFDEITGSMKFAGQEAVSLQKQVRLLRQELTLGTYTEQQFSQIQKALQETEIKLKQSQIRGKEFFEQIGTLGGPIGELANRIDRAIKLFAALDKMTFDELRGQIENIGKTLSGNVEGISDVISVEQTGGRPAGVRESTGSAGEAGRNLATGASVVAATEAASAAKTLVDANNKVIESTKKLNSELAEEYKAAKKVGDVYFDNNKGQVEFVSAQQNVINAVKNRSKEEENLTNVSSAYLKKLNERKDKEFQTFVEGTKSFKKYQEENAKLLETAAKLEEQFQDVTFVVEEGTLWIGVNDKALRALNATELQLIATNEALALSEQGYIVTLKQANAETAKNIALQERSAVVTSFLSRVLNIARGVAVAYNAAVSGIANVLSLGFAPALKVATVAAQGLMLVLGAFVGFGLGTLLPAIKEFITGFAEMGAAAEQMGRNVSNVEKILELNLANAKRRQSEERAQMEKNNASSAELRKKDIQDLKENLKLISKALDQARANELKAQVEAEKEGGFFGISEEAAKQQAENVKNAGDTRLKLEQKYADTVNEINVKGTQDVTTTTKEGLNRRLKEIDANIENEIYSELTRTKVLEQLYKERNKIVDELDKDKEKDIEKRREQIEERTRIQSKKILNAQIDDNLLFIQEDIDYYQRKLNEVGKGSKEEFELKKELADQNFKKEMEEAKRDQKTRETNEKNARSNYYKTIKEIDIDEAKSRQQQKQIELEAEFDGTQSYYAKLREVEEARYKAEQVAAQLNYEKLEALKKEHEKKMNDIDVQEMLTYSDLMLRRSQAEDREYSKRREDAIEAENARFEAEKKAAGDNALALETLQVEHTNNLRRIDEQYLQSLGNFATQTLDSFARLGSALASIADAESKNMSRTEEQRKASFEKNKEYQKKIAVISAASGIIQILTQPSTLPSPFDWIVKGINATALGIATAAQMKVIDQQQFQGSGRSMIKHHQYGGLIEGKRHSEGGTLIEAEQGEAVMTRGAVTMFAPLLSALNQMGGGTAFSRGAVGQASFDNPQVNNTQMAQNTITKTYIVENELTTLQQRQARLKDLSTI